MSHESRECAEVIQRPSFTFGFWLKAEDGAEYTPAWQVYWDKAREVRADVIGRVTSHVTIEEITDGTAEGEVGMTVDDGTVCATRRACSIKGVSSEVEDYVEAGEGKVDGMSEDVERCQSLEEGKSIRQAACGDTTVLKGVVVGARIVEADNREKNNHLSVRGVGNLSEEGDMNKGKEQADWENVCGFVNLAAVTEMEKHVGDGKAMSPEGVNGDGLSYKDWAGGLVDDKCSLAEVGAGLGFARAGDRGKEIAGDVVTQDQVHKKRGWGQLKDKEAEWKVYVRKKFRKSAAGGVSTEDGRQGVEERGMVPGSVINEQAGAAGQPCPKK